MCRFDLLKSWHLMAVMWMAWSMSPLPDMLVCMQRAMWGRGSIQKYGICPHIPAVWCCILKFRILSPPFTLFSIICRLTQRSHWCVVNSEGIKYRSFDVTILIINSTSLGCVWMWPILSENIALLLQCSLYHLHCRSRIHCKSLIFVFIEFRN